ncbi:MAG: DUF3305 domain-containing protein [Hyphomicrobiales bacterium]
MSASIRIPVGVVVERRKADSPWIDFTWRPLAALPGEPDASPWTMLSETADGATFYAGRADVMLHSSETSNYRDNLATGEAKLWVVLRPTGAEPPFAVVCVTADGSEGEGYTSAGNDIVEQVPMPEAIRGTVDVFVAEHHVEQPFFKRKRDRANLDALGRRTRPAEDEG